MADRSVLLVGSSAEMEESLVALGVTVVVAQSGSKALELLCEQDPALAVFDLNLPDMNGIELSSLVHRDVTHRHMPIVLHCKYEDWDWVAYRAHEAGVVDYFSRPFRSGLVRSKLRAYLELHDTRVRERAHMARLERSNREFREFAHAAAHDLKSPLRGIKAHSKVLLEGEISPEAHVKHLESIAKSVARMEMMLTHMLEYAEADSRERALESVDVEACIVELLEEMKAHNHSVDATLRVDALPALTGDSAQLRRLFQNILENAFKYRRQGVPLFIQVGCVLESSNARISIEDNGTGFDMKWHDDVFRPFRRLVAVRHGGSGIGMATAKRIVERHGGSIHATSVPGRGTTFVVILPMTAHEVSEYRRRERHSRRPPGIEGPTLAESATASLPEPSGTLSSGRRGTKKVLVVDDCDEDRNRVISAVDGYFEVISATNAEAALSLVGEDVVAVLSDYQMPGHSGVWLLSEVARRAQYTQRVLITGCPDEHCTEALATGIAQQVFTKPAAPVDIRRILGVE